MTRARILALALASAGFALASAPSAALAQAAPVYSESPADTLARNVRILADDPKNFDALIAAGKASVRIGDTQAAAGFFGRAEEINGNSPLPPAGMGAALAEAGDPSEALTYFARAQQLGASAASIGCDRGLAYDLLGNQVAAQTDYRAALSGADHDEARRRLALSLAISGKKTLAMTTLQPLLQKRETAAQRVRALVLALDGDFAGARTALDYTMPGASARMDPFFRRLPGLSNVQKAAAVHLGIFPDSGVAVASNTPPEDRLASIDQLLNQPGSEPDSAPEPPPARYMHAAPAPAPAEQQTRQVQLASISRSSITNASSPNNDLIQTARVASSAGGKKIWLQLASGSDADALPDQFRKIRSRKPSLFTGISGFVASADDRARLVIGPFHTEEDARLFADALSSVRIDSTRWVSGPGQVVRKLSTQ
jgi:Flp pilus assembly protein TadD